MVKCICEENVRIGLRYRESLFHDSFTSFKTILTRGDLKVSLIDFHECRMYFREVENIRHAFLYKCFFVYSPVEIVFQS